MRLHVSRRRLAASLLLATACFASAAATRHPSDPAATDAAFNALFALPQGLSDDSRFPTEGGEGAPGNEDELRGALDEQLKAGADVNAYRHGGTLLLHALRAGLDDTALWLLAHGANPRLEVEQVDEGGTDGKPAAKRAGDDALQVALMFHRWRVVDALLRRPDMKPASDTDRAFRWSTVFVSRDEKGTPALAVRELRRRGLPLPGGWQGDCLLAHALDEGLVSLVLALPATTPAVPGGKFKGRDAAVAALCVDDETGRQQPRRGPASGDHFKDLAPADLARADGRLAVPLMPALMPTLAGPQDAAALARLPLRHPFDDRAFVRSLVVHALDSQVPPAVTRAVLAPVPPAALAATLDDPELLKAWLSRFAGQPVEAYAWALKAVSDEMLRRHVDLAVAATSNTVTLVGQEILPTGDPGTTPATAAHWQALLPRLPSPPGTRADLHLTRLVPEAAWPALFARHPVIGPDELAENLRATSRQADLDRRWALLRTASTPESQARALAILVQPWTQGCASDGDVPTPEDVARVKWLVAAGVRPPKAAALAVSCEEKMKPTLRAALLGTHVVVAAPPAGQRHFVLDHPACDPQPEPELLRALAAGRFLKDPPSAGGPSPATATPAVVQAIAEPGRARCAWLVSGGNDSARAFIDDESFYDGYQRLTPCLDATLHGELWRVVDGRVQAEAVGEGAVEGGVAVREAKSGRRFFLTWPVPGSTCDGGHPAQLLGWSGGPPAQHLRVLGDDDADRAALQRQCHLEEPGACFGLAPHDGAANGDADADADAAAAASAAASTPARPRPWDAAWGVADFVDHHWADHRRAWIAVFLALDVAKLDALTAEGMLPRWRVDALSALNAARMPVEAKRQRTAWMFRDKAGMAESFGADHEASPAVLGLVAWLPREDWRPMVSAMAGRTEALKQLREAAMAAHDVKLACVFSRSLGEACVGAAP